MSALAAIVLPQPAGPVIIIFLPLIADLTRNFHFVSVKNKSLGLRSGEACINDINSTCSVGRLTSTSGFCTLRLSNCSHVDPLYQLGPSIKYFRSTVPIVRVPSLSIIFTALSPSLNARLTRSLDTLSLGHLNSLPLPSTSFVGDTGCK